MITGEAHQVKGREATREGSARNREVGGCGRNGKKELEEEGERTNGIH